MLIIKILLLTQQPGQFNKLGLPLEDASISNRSCSLYVIEQKALGNEIKQLKIMDCHIVHDQLLEAGEVIPINKFDGVVLRTWDGGENSREGVKIQAWLEEKGLFVDNPSEGISITQDKLVMEKEMELSGIRTPKTFYFKSYSDNYDEINSAFSELAHNGDSRYPVAVLKCQHGTHGHGIHFYFQDEKEKYKKELNEGLIQGKKFILQAYIRPNALSISSHASAGHYRLIISMTQEISDSLIGGIYFQRKGSWISNSHHNQGTLSKRAVTNDEIPLEVLIDLRILSKSIGINQVGADLILSEDGYFYLLELNNGMGISGPLLEAQGVAMKYAKNFHLRLSEHVIKNASCLIKDRSPTQYGFELKEDLGTLELALSWACSSSGIKSFSAIAIAIAVVAAYYAPTETIKSSVQSFCNSGMNFWSSSNNNGSNQVDVSSSMKLGGC